tara:strand:- start:17050 stop:17583 length:534 start_codon:yes stop_codon:yes gene_type:complete
MTDAADIKTSEMREIREYVDEINVKSNSIQHLEAKLKLEKEAYAKLVEEDLPLKLAEFGMSEIKMDDGSKIVIKNVYRGHISKDNQQAAFNWLRENNFDDIIKNEVKVVFGKGEDDEASKFKSRLTEDGVGYNDREYVHHSTLSGFIREQTEKGKALPQDLLGIYVGQEAQIKRGVK